MFKLIFRSPWPVPAVLALLCFLAAGWFYDRAVKDQAEAAIALHQGVPAPVSLNAFNPAKDVHPADEVHVIGWVNTYYNYELTETNRKRSDVVRRMFVLFGPEDAADSKQVRAVVLMPEGDVERFVAGITENLTGPLDERLFFSLNGTAERSPTLAIMANAALVEKGLTKAPGFQFIDIWPAKGREAALAPDPTLPMTMAAFPAVPGLILLLIAFFKFRHRNRVAVPNPAAVAEAMAHAAKMKKMQDAQAQQFSAFASAPATASASRPETATLHAPSAGQPVVRSRAGNGFGSKLGKVAGAALTITVLYLAIGDKPLTGLFSGLSMPTLGSSATPGAPASIETALAPAATVIPGSDPLFVATESALIPDAASLRPQTPKAAPDPIAPAAVVAATVAMPDAAAVVVAAADPAPEAEATPDPTDTVKPADTASFLSAIPLPDLGSLLVLGPIGGAVLLAIAALALMRGRQAAPPHVFAGKDPWARLARDARGKA